MDLLQKLQSSGPKRILALDGGGIRGALTLGYLEKTEQILRHRHNDPTLKLCDYFDLIGGTSTGAIIAGALAIGLDVATVKQKYLDLGAKVFSKRSRFGPLFARFDPEQLRAELAATFEDRTLGDASIKTGLCLVTKRADTNSTWPLINHPDGKYYPKNSGILLRRAIRASTAAPTYFVPEGMDVGDGQPGAFVDGGVSMANNPALLLFLVATLDGFPFHWETGEDRLLLLSIGTGTWRLNRAADSVMRAWLKNWAEEVPDMLMNDANWQNQLLLQCLSRTPAPWVVNREVGAGNLLTPEPLLTYLRYNVWMEENGLNKLGLARLVPKLDSLRELSAGENRYDLAEIGQKAAEVEVKDVHFPEAFNLPRNCL